MYAQTFLTFRTALVIYEKMHRYETAFFLQPRYQVEETDAPTASRPDPEPIKFTTLLLRLVEALRYRPEGRGFNSRCHWNFSLTKFSGRTMALGFTQPLTKMSTR